MLLVAVVVSVGGFVFLFSPSLAAFNSFVHAYSAVIAVAVESLRTIVVSGIGIFLTRVWSGRFIDRIDGCLGAGH